MASVSKRATATTVSVEMDTLMEEWWKRKFAVIPCVHLLPAPQGRTLFLLFRKGASNLSQHQRVFKENRQKPHPKNPPQE